MSKEQIDVMLQAAFMAGADRAFESWVWVSVKQHDDGAREIYKDEAATYAAKILGGLATIDSTLILGDHSGAMDDDRSMGCGLMMRERISDGD